MLTIKRLKLKNKMKLLSAIKGYLNQIGFLIKKSWLFRAVFLCLVILIAVILFSQLFISAKKLNYSFATNQSCINSLSLLPNIQKKSTSSFEVINDKYIKIFKYPILSKKICIKAKSIPQENKTTKASISLLGNSLIKRNIQIIIPEYPKAYDVLAEKSFISVAQPLQFKLNQADSVFNYELSANGIKTKCIKKQLINVSCDTASLRLKHANIYKFSISRTFNGQKVSMLAEAKIPTISALNITSSTITNNQTVYDKPKTIEINTDKPIQLLDEVKLSTMLDSKAQNVDIDTKFSGKKIIITARNELKRGSNYKLTIKDIISIDRGSLVAPFEVYFYTSKGPLVSSINISDRSTAVNQPLVIHFDQSLQPNQDLAKYINITVNGQNQQCQLVRQLIK